MSISKANIQPVMYPAQPPRKRLVYSAKEPEIGIRTAISPERPQHEVHDRATGRYTSSTDGPAAWIAPAEP